MLDIQTIIILALIAFIFGLIVGIILIRPSTLTSRPFHESAKGLSHPVREHIIRKEISWQLISNTLVTQTLDNNKGKVQVLFGDEPIDDARLVILKIWNTGNMPISPEDYENNNPFELNFGENAVILDAEILDAVPSSLKESITAILNWSAGRLLLGPILLNSLDSITLKLLLAHFEGKVAVNTQIARVKQISLYTS